LIAEGTLCELSLDIPPAPSFAQAATQQARSPALARNLSRYFPDGIGMHPTCFCCGAQHESGLQVYAAPIDGLDQVAAAWPTREDWGDGAGLIPPRLLWAALDCPGQFAFFAVGIRTGMLGRLSARIERPIRAGENCVVTGWRIGIEGRRHFAGTAVFNAAGERWAYAKAVWVGRRDTP
jgi:hypothetical protein